MAFLGVIGSIVSAAGSIAGGISQSENARYQAQVARNNAIIASQNAEYATAAGSANAQTESLKGAAVAGRIKTGLAANNIDVNTGSAVDVEASQRELSNLDTQNVFEKSRLQAYGYRTQAVNYTAEAELHNAEASQAVIGGIFGGLGALAGSGKDPGTSGGLLSNANTFGTNWEGLF